MAQVLFEKAAELREDVVETPLGNEAALANAPQRGRGLFQGSQDHRTVPEPAAPSESHANPIPDHRQRARRVCSRADSAPSNWQPKPALRRSREPRTGAYLAFLPERAWRRRGGWTGIWRAGEDPGPLAGVPVAVKDVILTQGVRTTCGSKLLANYIPPYDATAVIASNGPAALSRQDQLRRVRHGVLHRKLGFRPGAQPGGADRVPGGSSGGSAAAVAQGTAVVALGSDTGGSIRQPASFCGVVGVTPTYGRVSRYGLTAFASSLDHIGPFARSVKDAATLLRVIAGRDPARFHLRRRPGTGLRRTARRRPKRPEAWTAPRVSKGLDERNRRLDPRGVEVFSGAWAVKCARSVCQRPTTPSRAITLLPRPRPALTWRASMACGTRSAPPSSETLSDMYRNTRGEGFGAECKRRIMLGTYVLSAGYYDAYYLKAQKVRALIARDFARAFEEVDAIVAPGLAVSGFQAGRESGRPAGHVSFRYLHDYRQFGGHSVHERTMRKNRRGAAGGDATVDDAFRRDHHVPARHALENAGGVN